MQAQELAGARLRERDWGPAQNLDICVWPGRAGEHLVSQSRPQSPLSFWVGLGGGGEGKGRGRGVDNDHLLFKALHSFTVVAVCYNNCVKAQPRCHHQTNCKEENPIDLTNVIRNVANVVGV